jgi:diguanylate cyclase (GGDEF)-like protein
LAAVLTGAFAGGRSIRWPRQARVFSAALGGLQGVAAALVASSFNGAPSHLRLVADCTAVAAAGGCVWVSGQALVCLVRRLPDAAVRIRRIDVPSTGAEVLVALAAAPPMILLYRDSGILPLLIFIGTLIAAFALFRAYRANLLDLHAEVERLSRTDPLTGLANRRAFDNRVDQELRRISRGGTPFGLLLIDVDHFKQLNDSYGHGAGDHILNELSRRLTGRLRDEDLLARIGGDEFAAIITNANDTQTLQTLARDLHPLVADTPFHWLHQPIHLTISAGIALADQHTTTRDNLLREADRTLYTDKAHNHRRTLPTVAQPTAQGAWRSW